MKGRKPSSSFSGKLVMTATLLFLGQLALAAGTTAGTDVVNLATVDYEVNGTNQEDIESAPRRR